MAPPRFFVDSEIVPGRAFQLPSRAGHHALRVLRLRAGDALTLFDGRGGEYRAQLLGGGDGARVQVLGFEPVEREASLRLTLIQALTVSEKIDWVVEKAVEIGVARVLIAPAARSIVRLDAGRSARRLQRWADIAQGACAQCGRNRLPEIAVEATFGSALARGADAEMRMILDPSAQSRDLDAGRAGSVAFAVGPEGGFTPDELASARGLGYAPTVLGPRVMRTETAGLAIAAVLLASAGEYLDQEPGS